MENITFSQRFPFTEKAKEALKEMNISIDDVPEQAIRKAALMVSNKIRENISISEKIFTKEEIKLSARKNPSWRVIGYEKANIVSKYYDDIILFKFNECINKIAPKGINSYFVEKEVI